MFYKEAYLIVKIKSSEKNYLKAAYTDLYIFFFSKLYLNQTHVELIDDKFLYQFMAQ